MEKILLSFKKILKGYFSWTPCTYIVIKCLVYRKYTIQVTPTFKSILNKTNISDMNIYYMLLKLYFNVYMNFYFTYFLYVLHIKHNSCHLNRMFYSGLYKTGALPRTPFFSETTLYNHQSFLYQNKFESK